MASRRSVVAQTLPGSSLSRSIRCPNASMRRSFDSVGLISANSLSASAGVAMMSLIRVLQKTTLPAPIMAIFLPLFAGIFLFLSHVAVGSAAIGVLGDRD